MSDTLLAGNASGKIRAMLDENGKILSRLPHQSQQKSLGYQMYQMQGMNL